LAAETSNALDGLERLFARFDVVSVSRPVATAAPDVVATLQRAG
jgi:tRNA(fMet)-specific endonuclease VapC